MKKILSLSALLLGCGVLFAVSYKPADIKNPKPMDMAQMKADPMGQFQEWYSDAKQEMGDLNASIFVLGTVNESCEPSTRSMVAKYVDGTGFTFYGDKDSAKFLDLQQNPAAAATFVWTDEQRQVNFRGKAVPVTQKERQAAFDKRDKGSQVTSNLSDQGQDLTSMSDLKTKHQAMSKQYQNKKVPMADSWVGYRFEPEVVLFWQAGADNMHSRVMYSKEKGKWVKKLVQP